MNYPVGPAIDHLRPCVHCAVCGVHCALCCVHCALTLCTVQCVVSAVLCCALHSGGKHPFSPICVALFGRLPVWPNDKRYKMPAKEKNTDTKEHFKSSLWSDSLGWHNMQDQFVKIATMSNTKFHDILPIYAFVCTYMSSVHMGT